MSKFGDAFKAARAAGKKEFTWNGKSYHTRTAEEESGKSTSTSSPSMKGSASGSAKMTGSTWALSNQGGTGSKPSATASSRAGDKPKSNILRAASDVVSAPARAGAAVGKIIAGAGTGGGRAAALEAAKKRMKPKEEIAYRGRGKGPLASGYAKGGTVRGKGCATRGFGFGNNG